MTAQLKQPDTAPTQAALSHLDHSGAASMVDISDKSITRRMAQASAIVITRPAVIELISNACIKKGDVLATARIAGIMAAKKTADLIPLCHPLAISTISIDFETDMSVGSIAIRACCITLGQTGVEMEALTAASVAALTIYDMCKAVDKNMEISSIYLEQKSGGKNGNWNRKN